MTHICKYCKTNLNTPIGNRKFCTTICRSKYYYEQKKQSYIKRICNQCGTEITSPTNNTQCFCSTECYWQYRRDNPHSIIQSNQTKDRIIKTCKHCGNEFETHRYRMQSAFFCSDECKYEYKRLTKKCPTCNVKFKTPRHVNHTYCSSNCAAKGIAKRKSKPSRKILKLLHTILGVTISEEFRLTSTDRSIWIDFVIDNKIAIEVMGDYWHCNPSKYNSEYYHKQKKMYARDIWEYDESRKKFIEDNGMIAIFLWECDINNKRFTINQIKEQYELLKNNRN